MKRLLTTAALLLGAAQAQAAAASLAQSLPAGALLTLETHNAGGAIDRFAGVVGRVVSGVSGEDQSIPAMLGVARAMLRGSVGQEAVLGVFSVGRSGGTFSPEVLAITRADQASASMLGGRMPDPTARVGKFTFARQGSAFVGSSGGLIYLSTDKTLLMNYLGRLSGKLAPRLADSPAYAAPAKAVGQQELSFYLNFSASAKLLRGYLAQQIKLPRLMSPIVDALDTLGQYRAGFSTTEQGLSAQSALAANRAGKDQPLYRILTDSTDFAVQNIIPADVEGVVASACNPEGSAYLARWLTRFDLFEPLGFLTDSQLADHLEKSAHYLGHECAQVTLSGGMKAGLNTRDPLSRLGYSVSYTRVQDMAVARAQMPEFARNLNAAIAGARLSLKNVAEQGRLEELTQVMPGDMSAVGLGLSSSLSRLDSTLARLNLVYAFRDDYLITAYSQQALDKALAQTPDTLAQSADFQATRLNTTGAAGWTFVRNPAEISGEEMNQAILANMGSAPDLGDSQELRDRFNSIGNVTADLINRYDGYTSHSQVMGHLIRSKSSLLYRW